jgi:hypothetical protein
MIFTRNDISAMYLNMFIILFDTMFGSTETVGDVQLHVQVLQLSKATKPMHLQECILEKLFCYGAIALSFLQTPSIISKPSLQQSLQKVLASFPSLSRVLPTYYPASHILRF